MISPCSRTPARARCRPDAERRVSSSGRAHASSRRAARAAEIVTWDRHTGHADSASCATAVTSAGSDAADRGKERGKHVESKLPDTRIRCRRRADFAGTDNMSAVAGRSLRRRSGACLATAAGRCGTATLLACERLRRRWVAFTHLGPAYASRSVPPASLHKWIIGGLPSCSDIPGHPASTRPARRSTS